jgi:hypothetical protein
MSRLCPAPLLAALVFSVAPTRVSAEPAAPAPPPPPRSARWPVGWSALGGAVVSAGVGVAFGLRSLEAEADHKAATTGAAKRRTADDARGAATDANICFAVAGALVATGVTLLVIETRPEGGPTAAPAPGGGVVGWAGRF